MRTLGFIIALLAVAATVAQAEVVVKTVEYQQGEVTLEGKAFYDNSIESKRPGVLIVHQWMGPIQYESDRAGQLARMGYAVFVADIFGKGVRPADTKQAAQEAGKYRSNRALLRARAASGLKALRALPMVDQSRIVAIGYCFGGSAVLELARSGARLNGVVSFHGTLDTPTPADAKNIQARVLVLHGADDPYAPAKQVDAFHREMRDANVAYKFVAYPGAVHAYSQKGAGDDPSKGVAYNAKADAESWQEMKAFFADIFK